MAEVNDEVIGNVYDDTDSDFTTDDDSTDSPDEISYEQALEWKKKADRLDKAEKSIVEYKRRAKQPGSSPSESGEFVTKAQLAIDKFLDKNPELNDYTTELEAYSKKGLSLDEAKTLILNSDSARINREKLNSLGLSDGETTTNKTTVTRAELEKLAKSNQSEYNRIRDLMDTGKIMMK